MLFNETIEKKRFTAAFKQTTKEIPDLHNAKEHFQSFLRKKNKKPVKQSEIITYQPKTYENPSTVNKKSVIIEHSETLHKLSKVLGKGKKVVFNNSYKK